MGVFVSRDIALTPRTCNTEGRSENQYKEEESRSSRVGLGSRRVHVMGYRRAHQGYQQSKKNTWSIKDVVKGKAVSIRKKDPE